MGYMILRSYLSQRCLQITTFDCNDGPKRHARRDPSTEIGGKHKTDHHTGTDETKQTTGDAEREGLRSIAEFLRPHTGCPAGSLFSGNRRDQVSSSNLGAYRAARPSQRPRWDNNIFLDNI